VVWTPRPQIRGSPIVATGGERSDPRASSTSITPGLSRMDALQRPASIPVSELIPTMLGEMEVRPEPGSHCGRNGHRCQRPHTPPTRFSSNPARHMAWSGGVLHSFPDCSVGWAAGCRALQLAAGVPHPARSAAERTTLPARKRGGLYFRVSTCPPACDILIITIELEGAAPPIRRLEPLTHAKRLLARTAAQESRRLAHLRTCQTCSATPAATVGRRHASGRA